MNELIVQKLSATYDHFARDSETHFAEGLGLGNIVRRVFSPFGGGESLSWLDKARARLQDSAAREIEKDARQLAKVLLAELQAMMDELSQSLAERQERSRERVELPETKDQQPLVEALRSRLQRIPVGEGVLDDNVPEEHSQVSRFAFAGSGLTLLGTVIVAVRPLLWLQTVGAAFFVIGLVLLLCGLFWRRLELQREFRRRVDQSRAEFQQRLERELADIVVNLFYSVRQALSEPIFRLELRASQIASPTRDAFTIAQAATELLAGFRRRLLPRISNYN